MVVREQEYDGIPGLPVVMAVLAASGGLVWTMVQGARNDEPAFIIGAGAGLLAVLFIAAGLFMVNPNEGRVLQLFGDYKGTARVPGLRWANPFLSKRQVSLRVRNFESSHLKVNDNEGNPIEIASVVVWKVVDTAEAVFEVDDYEHYVRVQAEAALRNLATSYAYDAHDDTHTSLRGHTAVVADHLKREVQERLAKAGVQVIEARISHLAYAPEIAAAMLQRQQAAAVVAARQKIVEGAVGMVELAMEQIHAKRLADFSPEQKAQMVTNLLVVLVSERGAQPVVSTGHGQ
jgi:hypothetical protein